MGKSELNPRNQERQAPFPLCLPWNLRVVVAGCPRGGTQYMSSALRYFLPSLDNITVGHEQAFPPTGPKEFTTVAEIEVSGFVWPYARDLKNAGIPILHMVRHPVASVNSMCNFFTTFQDNPLGAALHWLKVHLITEAYADATYRLEYEPALLLWQAGWHAGCRSGTVEDIDGALKTAPRGNSTAGKRYGWDDLPKVVQQYATRLGYKETP